MNVDRDAQTSGTSEIEDRPATQGNLAEQSHPTTAVSKSSEMAAVPLWLHFWSWLTLLATFPLLTFGAEVTTKGVGMVDKEGYRHPWEVWQIWVREAIHNNRFDYFLEHSHRLMGFVVGCCVIVLMVGLLATARVRWLKYLGVAALLAVISQGLLGIFRVNLNALMGRNLALIHGCTAQLIFGLLASIIVFTSRTWWRHNPKQHENVAPYRLRLLAILTLVGVYLQLVLGGFVRHSILPGPEVYLAGRLHMFGAFVVTGMLIWFLRDTMANSVCCRTMKMLGLLLSVGLFCQLALGIEAWLYKFQFDAMVRNGAASFATVQQSLMRSLHYVVGSVVFGITIGLALFVFRPGYNSQSISPPQLKDLHNMRKK